MANPASSPGLSPQSDGEQWEYYSTTVGTKVLKDNQTSEWLREAGLKGWELVAITPLSLPGSHGSGITTEVLYTFKRRLRWGP
jgi:hypothetical protein